MVNDQPTDRLFHQGRWWPLASIRGDAALRSLSERSGHRLSPRSGDQHRAHHCVPFRPSRPEAFRHSRAEVARVIPPATRDAAINCSAATARQTPPEGHHNLLRKWERPR
jgi:hypothetical protein